MMGGRSLLCAVQMACALTFSSIASVEAADGDVHIVRPATYVMENGTFRTRHATVEAAKIAALGNDANSSVKGASEFLFVSDPCADIFEYSLYFTDRRFQYKEEKGVSGGSSPHILAQVTALDQPSKPLDIEAVYDAKNPSAETIEDQLLAKLYAELLSYSYDPTVKCAPLPLGIIFKNGRYKAFERNNAGTPLVGTRFHDAAVIEATRITAEQAKARGDVKLAAKGVPNTFNSLNGATAAAMRIPGDKIIMFDGQAAHIYRADENRDIPGIGRQFKNLGEYVGALKKAKPANGMTILALVVGNKGAVPISTPAK